MAVCHWCDQEMTSATSCFVNAFHHSGVLYPLPPDGSEQGRRAVLATDQRCGDCGVAPGGAHHPGCDMAQCPICGGQLMSCGCRFDEGVALDDCDCDDDDGCDCDCDNDDVLSWLLMKWPRPAGAPTPRSPRR